jgi:serine-type D-Ala-D-Ala carboxypeptidase/endopeptidase (penicillin-binding protein 4)
MSKAVVSIRLYSLRLTVFIWLFVAVSSCSISKQINKQATKILLQDSAIATGHIGISIYEPATNKYWYNYNADKFFVPASNVKLFTLYAGMKYLGDSLVGLRYRKTFYPTVSDSMIEVKPSGDPTFLHSNYLKQSVFDFLKKQSKILISPGSYVEQYGKGWAWDDYDKPYMPNRSGLPMYNNIIKIKWINTDSISVHPKFFYNKNRSNSGFDYYDGFSVIKKIGTNDMYFFWGSDKNKEIPFNPDVEREELLKDTLPSLQFQQKGTDYPFYPNKEYTIIHSQSTDSLLKPMMYNSDNFFAEQTLLMVSNEHLGYMDDEKIIDTLLKKDFKKITQQPRWVDGSGLSRYNLFTPQSFIYILNKLKNEFGLERMKRILPTGGQGTIQNYYSKDSGYIFAKTGSMGNQATLSGYLITKQNKLLIFSILNNNFQGKSFAVKRAVEKFLEGIREKY